MSDESTAFRSLGPLADLRVIEMGVLLAGPFCGSLFADFGAEVIKVESPGGGDPMRGYGQAKADGEALWWPVVARNKKSITLNLRLEAEILHSLFRVFLQCDAFSTACSEHLNRSHGYCSSWFHSGT